MPPPTPTGGSPGQDGSIPEITVTELEERLDDGRVPVLVDVREPFEREIADLPEVGQLRIPVGELQARLEELDPGEEIVLYCRSGSRSAWATQVLRAQGFDRTFNLKGGILAWRQDVDPTLQAY